MSVHVYTHIAIMQIHCREPWQRKYPDHVQGVGIWFIVCSLQGNLIGGMYHLFLCRKRRGTDYGGEEPIL